MVYDDKIKVATQRILLKVKPQDLSTVLIIGDKSTFPTRTKIYSNTDDMIPDLTNGSADPEYKAATIAFSQSPKPSKVMIGREDGADTTLTDTLVAIFNETQQFFGLTLVSSRAVADQQLMVSWAQANDRVSAVVSSDANIIDQDLATDTTSISYYVNNGNFFNTIAMYHSAADTEYLDVGTLVYALQQAAGSYNLAGKEITGIVTHDSLDGSQEQNVFDKNTSIYTNLGGFPEIDYGNVGDGDFFDTIHYMYWSKVRLQEAMIGEFKKRGKVKHNRSGYARLKGACIPTFEEMENNDAIEPVNYNDDNEQIDGWDMTFPETVSLADKTARILRFVEVDLWYTGGVQRVEMAINIII